jgi:hypothetical protein
MTRPMVSPDVPRPEDEKKFDFLLAIVAGIISIGCFVFFQILLQPQEDWQAAAKLFGVGFLPSLAAVTVAYLAVSYLLGRRGLSPSQRLITAMRRQLLDFVNHPHPGTVEELTEQLAAIDWNNKIYEDAKSVIVTARFFDRIAENQTGQIKRLLDTGGRMTVLLPDPSNRALLALGTRERGDDITRRVSRTVRLVWEAGQASSAPHSLEIVGVQDPINYAAWLSVSQAVIWNPVEHSYDDANAIPMYYASADLAPDTVRAVQRDLERLRAQPDSRPLRWDPATNSVVPA